MESYKLAFKFFVQDASDLGGLTFVPVFHKWIQTHAVADHLAIDVADYQHVHQGPGTLLITLEANFAMDHAGGRLGLLYTRKQPIAGADTFPARLRAVLKATLEGAHRLEQDPALASRIKFRTDEFLFRINDRLPAPNTAATLDHVKLDLASLIKDVFGQPPIALERNTLPESLFEVTIKTAGSASVSDLLSRLAAIESR
jgi:hypothetical protein